MDVRADLTVKGHTAPMPLRTNVQVLDDGAVRITAQTTVNRKGGCDGNMLGMVGDKTGGPTWCSGRRKLAGICSMPHRG